MYTEENEFNYNDYLDDNLKENSRKPFFDFRFILKVILVILVIVLLVFIILKIRNNNKYKEKESETKIDSALVFKDNMNHFRDAAKIYFFDDQHLPQEKNQSESVNITALRAEKLLTTVLDENGQACGYNTSKAVLTKNYQDYTMKVNLECLSSRDEAVYYYDLEGNCLNCNGESYTPVVEPVVEEKKEDVAIEEPKEVTPAPVEPETPQVKVCQDFSDWTTEYRADNTLEVETRTLVKGFKQEKVYGDWSTPTTTAIVANDKLEVRSYQTNETVTSKTAWSSESTSKPSSKAGREISSRSVKKSSVKKSCTGGGTYTKTLTKWDNNAISCKSSGIGKVVCTYKSKKTCTSKKVYHTTTYYKYRDTITSNVVKTYYQSRNIMLSDPIYTDYILENEMPEGYQKVNGSEMVQYRYREKCGK